MDRCSVEIPLNHLFAFMMKRKRIILWILLALVMLGFGICVWTASLWFEFPHVVYESDSPDGTYHCRVVEYDRRRLQCLYRVELFGLDNRKTEGWAGPMYGTQLHYYNDELPARFHAEWTENGVKLYVAGGYPPPTD